MSRQKGKSRGGQKNSGNNPSEHQSGDNSDSRESRTINVDSAERQYSTIGGTVLFVCGLLRGSLSGLALAALGGGLIYRGQTGHCPVYEALEFSTAADDASSGAEKQRDGRQQSEKIPAPLGTAV